MEAAEWFSRFMGQQVKLVRMPPNFVRQASGKFWTEEFAGAKQVSFADGFPFLLFSQGR